jgi:transposase InsO family protein
MNVVDSVTKLTHFIPTHTTIMAEGATRLYLREVWKHHGTPRVVLSDRGSQFTTRFTRELYKLLGIELAMSTAYHPQTDGQTECVNQELEGYLRIFTSQQQDDWDDLLPLGEFSHNNNVHSSTQQTPFMVDTGRHPRMGFELIGRALNWSWSVNSRNAWPRDWRKQSQQLQRRRTSTPCTTTADASLPWSSNQETESG